MEENYKEFIAKVKYVTEYDTSKTRDENQLLQEAFVANIEDIKKKGQEAEKELKKLGITEIKVGPGEPTENFKKVVREKDNFGLIGFEKDRLHIFVNLKKKDLLDKLANTVLKDGSNDINEYSQIASLLHYVEA